MPKLKVKPPSKPNSKHLDQQLSDLTEKYNRALADYQNLQKRTQSQQGQFVRLASVNLIGKFITILDDLERAAIHLNDQGLNLVIDQFHGILETEGVTTLSPEDKPFNPEVMECLEPVPGKKDQVVTVVQRGYQLGDALIRPAQVTVGNGEVAKRQS